MSEIDNVVESDLDAYVDRQLDQAGRLRVEAWLARHPDAAARVMADLSMRTTLKLALAGEAGQPRAQTREAARRLSAGLDGLRLWASLRRVAAVGLMVSVGWLAHSSFAPGEVNASMPVPDFIDKAIKAHRAALAGVPAAGQGVYDREDIRAATAITMPRLPEDWQVAAVQIFPSDYGPTVETDVTTSEGMRLSLFAVRPGHFAVEQVKDVALADAGAAWWQIGEVAYVLVTRDRGEDLAEEAQILRNSLY